MVWWGNYLNVGVTSTDFVWGLLGPHTFTNTNTQITMAKTYRVKVEILHTNWKVGDILTEKDLEGRDIDWMLNGSQCIEEVALVETFQAKTEEPVANVPTSPTETLPATPATTPKASATKK